MKSVRSQNLILIMIQYLLVLQDITTLHNAISVKLDATMDTHDHCTNAQIVELMINNNIHKISD